ncbi:hypothetical protein CF319_g9387 [Tilletia indica]|nr:hypothetical protein CF319_g9387 [Tilletia indica]
MPSSTHPRSSAERQASIAYTSDVIAALQVHFLFWTSRTTPNSIVLPFAHKLEKENAELHDLLSDRLQLGGTAESSEKEEVGKKEKAGGGGGREAEGAKGLEDRAKVTVELLENELQDAHAVMHSL